MSKIVSMADFKRGRSGLVAQAGAAPGAPEGATKAIIADPGTSTDRLPR